MSMPRITIIAGIVLIVLGLGFYVGLIAAGNPQFTALIPAFPGVVLVVLGGAAAAAGPGWRKHLMHAAMVLGLLVALAGLGMGVPGLIREPGLAATEQTLMGLVGLVFVVLGVRSFIEARRARQG